NGVPDDCDIDVADPDGDGAVAPDCDGNGIVDNCDILGGVREIAQLRPSISAAGFQFGTSIAIDGDVIVVGSTTSPLRTTDKVFVFRRHGDAWLEEAVIQPAAGSGLFDEFIAIASGRIFIAQFESSFSSFRQIAVYERLDGEWRRTGTIGSAGEDSSECVAIGDEALVRESLANAASLYRQMEGEWTRVETYFSSLPDFPYRGGLAMNDEFAVVGAEGGFRVFDKNDSAMVSGPHLPISPENVVSSNRSIVMTDEFVVVGYPRVFAELSYDATGAVNVYRRHAGDEASSAGGVSWAPDAILTLGISGGQYQGVAVGAEGDRCFVGYPDYASADGAVGFYEYDGAAWQLRALIQPNISPSPLYFGAAIATSASYLAVSAGVGVSGVLNSSEDVVVVYAIDLDIDDNGVHDTCEVDCDANHYPDEGERTIDGFVGALLNGGALCVFDLNDDGALNGLDIDPMIEQLLTGP
ncbi:MAG: hypothetical protein KDA33_15355, partial [Phycisphaerales bacterium]|nr:hypothetical protein [Phycisphaerales bacterium]